MPTQMLTQPRRGLRRRPPHRRDDPRSARRSTRRAATPRRPSPASSPCRRPAPSRCRAAPASRRSSPTTRSTAWSAAPPTPSSDVATPTPRAGCPATCRPPRRPRSTATRPRPGSPASGSAAQVGATLTYDLAKPQALDQLDLQVIADGRHSVPTAMTIASGSQARSVTLPPIADSTVPGAVTTVPVSFAAAHRLALRRHLHRRPAGVRGQLLLGRPARPAAGHRRDRHPRACGGPDPGHAPRHLRVQPAHHRRPADRRRRRRARPSRP